MANFSKKFLFFVSLIMLNFLFCRAQTCKTFKFSNNKHFSACNDLPVLNATLHWNYDESSNTVDVAYTRNGLTDRRWIAWGINPTSQGMVGCQALVAFSRTDGVLTSYTSPITSYGTQLQSGNLTFPVSNVAATYDNSNLVIFATIQLPTNSSIVNHLWQEGPLSGDTPLMHSVGPSSPNVKSLGSLDLKSGKITETKSGQDSKTKLKYIHGVLNTVSWGILMPIGIIMARYLKVLRPECSLWFILHRACQLLAYFVGVAGWGTGMYLGYKSAGIAYKTHRNIGIALFCLATAQVFVAFARPGKDKKTRPYFNWFHYLVGYSTVAMSIANIYEGFYILSADDIWSNIYTAIVAFLGCAAVFLEAMKWYNMMKKSITTDMENQKETSTAEQV